jgi:Cytochrome c554 and c-prime
MKLKLILVAKFCLLLSCASLLLAQEPVAIYQPSYSGNATCLGCHNKPSTDATFPHDFCLMNEAEVWQKHDKHAQSFRLLVGVSGSGNDTKLNPQALGLAMLRRLTGDKLADRFEAIQVAEAKKDTNAYLQAAVALFLDDRSSIGFSCLTCHANLKPEKQYISVINDQQFRKNFVENAVSCEACHGPSEIWGKEHYGVGKKFTGEDFPGKLKLTDIEKAALEGKTWRELGAAIKGRLGFVEVRDPAIRAQQCFSCHIGDKQEGKFIPHDWYVAGHPPLPSMELATFANDMPRHWRHLAEKGQFTQREAFVAANEIQENAQALPESKAVLVGSVVALQKSVELLQSARSENKFLPDFAAFDCLACHQELRNAPVVTRERLDPSVPGRPGLPRWSTALIEISCDAFDPSGDEKKTFLASYDQLRASLTARPFGDPKLVAQHSATVIDHLKVLQHELVAHPLTTEQARQIHNQLLTVTKEQRFDFHSARQLAWALRRFDVELATPPDFAAQEGAAAANDFPAWFQDVRQKAHEAVIAREPEFLLLKLPATQASSIEENLPKWLQAANAFDPGQYSEHQAKQ